MSDAPTKPEGAPKRTRTRPPAKPRAAGAAPPAAPDAAAPDPPPVEIVEHVEVNDPDGGLTRALASAQAAFPAIAKSKTATVNSAKGNYTYKYADLSDVLAAVRPVLARNGLAILQTTDAGDNPVILTTELRHVGGNSVVSRVKLGQDPANPQAFGGALTYHRRYAIGSMLGIAPEEDTDAQHVPPAGRQERAPTPPAPVVPPPWATVIPEAWRDQVMRDATTLVGDDRDRAGKVLASIKNDVGFMPQAVAWVLRRLVEAAQAPPSSAPTDPAQAASGEDPQAATAPDPTAPAADPAVEVLPPAEPHDAPPHDAPPRADRRDAPDQAMVDAALEQIRKLDTDVVHRMAVSADPEQDPYYRLCSRLVWWERFNAAAATEAALNAVAAGHSDAAVGAAAVAAVDPEPTAAAAATGGHAPGTVELSAEDLRSPAALVNAGCICPAPLADKPQLEDGCPVRGHGIEF